MPSWLRQCLCRVFPLPSWRRHCLSSRFRCQRLMPLLVALQLDREDFKEMFRTLLLVRPWAGWLHGFRSDSNSSMLTHPARNRAIRPSGTGSHSRCSHRTAAGTSGARAFCRTTHVTSRLQHTEHVSPAY